MKLIEGIIRLVALLLLIALGLCGCNATGKSTDAPTEAPTDAPTEKPTSKPTSRPTQTEKPVVKKRVAITFDDGPHAENTEKIVDEMNKYGFHATFFVIGSKAEKRSGSLAMQYAVDNGNEIGIHAYTHNVDYGADCSDEDYESEISKTRDAILAAIPDYEIRLMRPVKGKMTDERVENSEYAAICWSIDTYDWKYTDTSEDVRVENIMTIVNKVLDNVKDGDIVLMHEVHENSYEAAVMIFETLYSRGFEVVTVSELIGDELESGRKYYSAK